MVCDRGVGLTFEATACKATCMRGIAFIQYKTKEGCMRFMGVRVGTLQKRSILSSPSYDFAGAGRKVRRDPCFSEAHSAFARAV